MSGGELDQEAKAEEGGRHRHQDMDPDQDMPTSNMATQQATNNGQYWDTATSRTDMVNTGEGQAITEMEAPLANHITQT